MQKKPSGIKTSQAIAFIVLVCALGGAGALLFAAENTKRTKVRASAKSIRFVPDGTYEEECASCHVGFLPGFLPRRSWIKLVNGLDDHFGENASLDKPLANKIKKYLVRHAADTPKSSPRSKKIADLIPRDETPLRITDTLFWQRKHYSIKGWVWKREKVGSKARCDSCHRDANKGLFSEYDVKIPKA
jgi:hypothetical protein